MGQQKMLGWTEGLDSPWEELCMPGSIGICTVIKTLIDSARAIAHNKIMIIGKSLSKSRRLL